MRDRMDELVAAYLGKGRAYASMTPEELQENWVAAFTAVAFGDNARLDELFDLRVELRLRGLPPPEHLVRPEALAALQRRFRDAAPPHFEAVAKNIGRIRDRWQRDAVRPS